MKEMKGAEKMAYKMTFKRYELKYLMDSQQKANILQSMNAN